MYNKILNLTKALISVPSVNATEGEKNIAEFIYSYLSELPYFKKHPELLIKDELKDDPLHRFNVYGLLIGEKSGCPDTIMLHGHIDTVSVDDFGALKEYAFNPDRLREEMLKIKDTLAEEVRDDLVSGKYLFGRGSSDMKSGDAVHIAVFEMLSQHPEQLDGNILISFNPVEESLHKGFIDGIHVIEELKEKYGLNYIFAINNDFICGMYPGDTTRYIYTGSVGKVLPCFYVKGKETHVGQAFEGIDACRINAELVRLINLNVKLCDGYKGEYPAPPTALKARDLKPFYSVQTPIDAFSYFNYMVHSKSVDEILAEFKEIAETAAQNVRSAANESYKEYCRITGVKYSELPMPIRVMEYRELLNIVREKNADADRLVNEIIAESMALGEDKRENSLAAVKKLSELSGITEPMIVLFFATPFCPHNTLKDELPEEKRLSDEIAALADEYGRESGESYKLMYFFPSLTDSSYLKIDDDSHSVMSLAENFPGQELLYPVPYEKIMKLNIPGINYGCFGKDAHKWTERVDTEYSFRKLPGLIIKTIGNYLIKK